MPPKAPSKPGGGAGAPKPAAAKPQPAGKPAASITGLVVRLTTLNKARAAGDLNDNEFQTQRKDAVIAFITATKAAGGAVQGKRPPSALLGQASAALAAKPLDEAVRLFTEAVEAAPWSADAWLGRGSALAKHHAPLDEANVAAECEACLKRAIELDAGSADAHAALGLVLAAQGFCDEAEVSIGEALRISPDHAVALLNLASVQYSRGDEAGALRSLRRSVEMDDRNGDAHYSLGNLLAAGLGTNEDAEAEYVKAIAASPTDASPHLELGGLLEQRGDVAGAEAEYRTAAELSPGDADAMVALGNLLRHAKDDSAGAEDCYRRALDLDPRHADARYNLGSLLRANGDDEGAEEFLRSRLESIMDDDGSEYSLCIEDLAN